MRDESRPPRPATATTTSPHSITAGRPTESVLQRLGKVRRTSSGWSAACPGPNHGRGDRNPSLSISEAGDGKCLLCCHAGCTADEVTRALGLELRDLFAPRNDSRPFTPRRRRRAVPRSLAWRRGVGLEWAISRLLAPLPLRLAHQDILSNWGLLTEILDVDIPFVMSTIATIRGFATFRHCDRHNASAEDIDAAVRRFLAEIDDQGRAA